MANNRNGDMANNDKQIRYNPNNIAYTAYRTFRPPGQHPKPAHWDAIRAQAFERDGNQCRGCSAKAGDVFPGYGPVRLEVHHRHYDNWGREQLDDVTVLCKECHRGITDRFMYWRDQAREVNARGTDATPPEPLPAKPAAHLALPVSKVIDYGSLPAGALPGATAPHLKNTHN